MNSAPDRPRRVLWLLSGLISLSIVASTIYAPSLPDMARELNATISEIQATLTVFLVGFGLGQLIYGPLSDRFGRRIIMVTGLLITVAASLACAIAPSIGFLIGARIAQSVGACAGTIVARAVIRDLYDRSEAAKANSLLGVILALAPAVAPLVGGYLHVWLGWRAVFVFVAICGVGLLLLLLRFLPETHNPPQRQTGLLRAMWIGYRQLAGARDFLAYALLNGALFAALYAFIIGAPVIAIDVAGIGPDEYGMVASLPPLGYLLGSLLSSRLTMRLGLDRMVDAGTILMTAAGLVLAALPLAGHFSIAGLIGPMVFWSVGMGIALPNAIAGAVMSRPEIAGSAAALSGLLQQVGAIVGTVIVLSLPQDSWFPLTLTIATACIAGCVLWFSLRPALPDPTGQS